MSNNQNGSVTFPYSSFDAAVQDKFAKLGGPAEAFRYMSNGFKQEYWRKGANEKRQDKIKAALKFVEDYAKKHPESATATRR